VSATYIAAFAGMNDEQAALVRVQLAALCLRQEMGEAFELGIPPDVVIGLVDGALGAEGE